MKEKESEDVKRCFIIITSDKGLAGSYNHNVFKLAERRYIAGGKDNTICAIGYMSRNYYLNNPKVKIDDEFVYPAAEPTGDRARGMAEHVIEKFEKDEFERKQTSVYTKMINSMSFEAKAMKILPLSENTLNRTEEEDDASKKKTPVDFSPSPVAVLRHIVPNYVKGLLYGAMVESYACEQSSRMTAMDNATTNAKEMITELSLIYNRVRQAAITQEITEIVSGAQSQNN